MKAFILLAVVVATASAVALKDRVNGENGWYVPKADGTYYWVDADQKPSLLKKFENGLEKVDNSLDWAFPFPDMNPVQFYLLTPQNPAQFERIEMTVDSIKNSSFNPYYPTKFSIHGWRMTYQSSMNPDVAAAWFIHGDYNIIVPNWPRAQDLDYISSVSAVPGVGKKVAAFIDFLNENFNLDFDKLEVIGHSLGAQVSGFAGKNVQRGKINTIVALDAALPLFNVNDPSTRLCSTDATYVQAIHTCGGKLGFLTAIGTSDFYPNGGVNQPGCFMDIFGICDHQRSVLYYVEAVSLDNFASVKCSTYEDAVNDKCGALYSGVARMGAVLNVYKVDGDYYVPVNSEYPYGTLTP